MNKLLTNIVVAGLGGQGVIKASDILAEAAFITGFDVKKSEIHGMSQRGGSVFSDVRFGEKVFSPVIPIGETDYLLVLDPTQTEINLGRLKKTGIAIEPKTDLGLSNPKSLNIAMLGTLSLYLDKIPLESWVKAIHSNFKEKLVSINLEAFEAGRKAGKENR